MSDRSDAVVADDEVGLSRKHRIGWNGIVLGQEQARNRCRGWEMSILVYDGRISPGSRSTTRHVGFEFNKSSPCRLAYPSWAYVLFHWALVGIGPTRCTSPHPDLTCIGRKAVGGSTGSSITDIGGSSLGIYEKIWSETAKRVRLVVGLRHAARPGLAGRIR